MLLFDTAQINMAYLQTLCTDQCPESDTLDFKRDAPGSADRDKHELAKDVSALANAGGGDLVYGIEDSDGHASKIAPIEVEPFDAFSRRIAQVLDAWVEPRVTGIQIFSVNVNEGFVAFVRVPASYDGPHCVRKDNNRRFVMRNGAGTSDLTFDQLRGAFGRTASLTDSAAEFIKTRQKAFDTAETPRPIGSDPIALLQVVPIAGLAGRLNFDVRKFYQDGYLNFSSRDWGGLSREFNLEGVAVYSPGSEDGYTQIYRTGAMEATHLVGEDRMGAAGQPAQRIVFSRDMVNFFRNGLNTYLMTAKSTGIVGPVAISVSLMQCEGFELATNNLRFTHRRNPYKRRHLIVPPKMIENLELVDIDACIRPLMDIVWQAFGIERCTYFEPSTGAYVS